ncbi:MAG: YaiI/YqxD family protein [bacterium]|nr:YaiI/YqxD family protein [bacterium]
MKIWVDADACPREAKELIYRAAERTETQALFVANAPLRVPDSPYLEAVRVPQGFDVADDYIAQEAAGGDIVITADIPLAARAVEKGAAAINPRGEVYTGENVGEVLALRNFMQEMRSGGYVQGGPAGYSDTDRHQFAAALDRTLTRLQNENPPLS